MALQADLSAGEERLAHRERLQPAARGVGDDLRGSDGFAQLAQVPGRVSGQSGLRQCDKARGRRQTGVVVEHRGIAPDKQAAVPVARVFLQEFAHVPVDRIRLPVHLSRPIVEEGVQQRACYHQPRRAAQEQFAAFGHGTAQQFGGCRARGQCERKIEWDEIVREEAEAEGLKKSEEWQTLAKKLEARVGELEPTAEQVTRYKGAIEKYLAAEKKDLPKHILALLDKLDPVDQIEYLSANRDEIGKGLQGVPPSPTPVTPTATPVPPTAIPSHTPTVTPTLGGIDTSIQ